MTTNEIPKKTIFVIMPFSATPIRDRAALNAFFQINLKERIENEQTLAATYSVYRSDDTFDITTKIIRDLYEADVVICDLSGTNANPNVMYELGVRLGITNRPVILVREEHPENRRIFDIQGFHIFEYSPLRYREVENYIIEKLRRFESGIEAFESPILRALESSPSVVATILRYRALQSLTIVNATLNNLLRLLGTKMRDYLRTSSSIALSEDVDELIRHVSQHREQLAKVDWGRFSFMPFPPPTLATFLNNLPLDQLLPERAAALVNTFVLEYLTFFFGEVSAWNRFEHLYGFIAETVQLSNVIDLSWVYVENRLDRSAVLTKLLRAAEDSSLLSQVLRNPLNRAPSASE